MASTKDTEIAWLNGLRAIAVVAVLLYHARLSWADTPLFGGGLVGVDVFFVISGYLVTQSLVGKFEAGDGFVRAFWVARIRRIVPALATVVAASFVAAFLWCWPSEFAGFSKSAAAAMTFVSNIYFYLQDPYEATANATVPLIHTWSLSVEAQFYLLYPLLLAGTLSQPRRMTVRLAVLTAASFAIALAGAWIDNSAAFFMAPSRFWEFGVGAIAASIERKRGRPAAGGVWALVPWIGLVLILIAIWVFEDVGYRPAVEGVVPVAGTVAILAFAHPRQVLARALSWAPIVGLGLISYSLYLWHQPILAFARLQSRDELNASTVLLLLAASIALSVVTWRYVEEPFRRRKALPIDKRAFQAAAAAAAMVCGGAAVATAYPQTLLGMTGNPLIYEPQRGAATRDGKPCPLNTVDDVCKLGDASAPATIAILGDSHVVTLSRPLGEMLKRHDRAAQLLPMLGCPFVSGVLRFTYPRDCASHAEAVFKRLGEGGFDSVVINDYRNLYLTGVTGSGQLSIAAGAVYSVAAGKESKRRLADVQALQRQTIQRLLDMGLRVFFVMSVPDGPHSVPDAVRERVTNGGLPYTTDLDAYLKRSKPLFEGLKEFERDSRFVPIYPHRAFCDEKTRRCTTHSDTRLYYTDSNHLSEDGARILAREIEKAMFGAAR